jgi:outer membrane protein assembly factor BamB
MICPNCAAPLTFSAGGGDSMQCPYCHTIVRLGSQSAAAAGGDTSNQNKKPAVGKIVALIVLLVSVPLGIIIALVVGHTDPTGILSPSRSEKPSFANMTLEFGSKGITPGHFDVASCISLDHHGHIYVGEGNRGRVQVFDTTGKYLSEFSVGEFDDFVADRDGTLYVASGGKLCRFNGATGTQLPDMERRTDDWLTGEDVPPDPAFGLPAAPKTPAHYRCVCCQTPGVIYAITGFSVERPRIVKLNAKTGRIQSVVPATAPPNEILNLQRILALPTGEIYGLDTEQGAVFRFSPGGAYVNKFGAAADEASSGDPPPSQLHWATSMASDSQGRIYIGNDSGIKVYDKNGNFIDEFGDGHFPNGLAIDDQDTVYACFNNCVREYVLQKH